MPKTIPLIRAANVLPLVRWLETNRLGTADYLNAADLEYWFALSPFDSIPTINAIELLSGIAKRNGPDVGARIVTEASLVELGYIGVVALGARTPLEALTRIQMSIPMHSTHENIKLEQHENSTLIVVERLLFKVDAASLHAIHVLFSSMVQQLCRFTGMKPPLLTNIEMCAHPEYGTAYLEDFFGCPVTESDAPTIRITINQSVAHNPFRNLARDRMPQLSKMEISPLADDRSLSASVRSVISSMLHGGEPNLERVARSSGLSVRSFQRRLNEEGTSFSEELDKVRTTLALAHLGSSDISLPELSERLGYSAQSSLTRAVRRLTGRTPSQLGDANPS